MAHLDIIIAPREAVEMKALGYCRPAASPEKSTTGNRNDSSLGMLTRKFMDLLNASTDATIDLNNAAEALKVRLPLFAATQGTGYLPVHLDYVICRQLGGCC